MQSPIGLRHTKSRFVHQGYWASGTSTSPGAAFDLNRRTGVRLIATDEMALVVGGGQAGGGDAIRMRLGNRRPQIGIGMMDGSGTWDWGAAHPNTAVHIQIVEDDPAGGDSIGIASVVRSDASSGGVGAFPDSSAGSFFFLQTEASADGAGRGLEAHAVRFVNGPSATSSLCAIEAGIHSGVGGNGTDKINGIHLLSVESADMALAGVPAIRVDSGIWIRGAAGYTHPIRVHDETATAQGIIFDVDFLGTATIYGGIDVTGPGKFIKGAFAESTALAERTLFQARTTDKQTHVPIIPNGTATTASVEAINNSTPTNAAAARLEITSAAAILESGVKGAGAALPLQMKTDGSVRNTIQVNGDIVPGTAALATNATAGFQFVESCAGTPTGTPTTYTGRVPMVVDTTGVKIWFYIGGSWKGVVVA